MKKLLYILLILAISMTVSAKSLRQMQMVIVDEFGVPVTAIDTVEIYDAGTTTTSTIYTNSEGGTELTNPMTTTSGGFHPSLGIATWWQAAASYKVTVSETGASQALTVDDLTGTNTRFAWFVNYIGEAATLQTTDDTTLDFGTSDDFYIDWDNANSKLILASAADGGRWDIGYAAVHTDIYWHTGAAISTDYVLFDEGSANVQFIDVDLLIDDEAKILIGDSSDVTIEYDEANNDLDITSTSALDEIALGATGDGYDIKWWSTTGGDYALFDYSADALILEDLSLAIGDAEKLLFGDTVGTGTMYLSVATAKLSLLQVVADTGTFDIGAAGTDVPTIWHGETSGAEVTFTGDTVLVDGIDMTFNDTDILGFGDSAAEGTIASDATGLNFTLGTSKALNFLRATTGTVNFGADNIGLDVVFFGEAASKLVWWDQSGDDWFFGADAEGVDVIYYGDTTLHTMTWDESGNVLSLDGDLAMLEFRGATVDAHELTVAVIEPTATNVLTLADDTGALAYIPTGSTTKDASDAALPITHAVVIGTSSGASAWSLPDGNPGQVLSVVIGTDGGAATITPVSTTGDGWATMIFTNDGEGATFMFVDATVGWVILGTFGVSTNPLTTGE